ncbi:MAG: hypothetical protein ACYCSP_16075 [Acidobacteriaceae bacterium]
MKTRLKISRTKLSTTVAQENFQYLQALVRAGRASSMAEAVDLAIVRMRCTENRQRLEQATAAYFEELSVPARAEEQALANRLHTQAGSIDFDREP